MWWGKALLGSEWWVGAPLTLALSWCATADSVVLSRISSCTGPFARFFLRGGGESARREIAAQGGAPNRYQSTPTCLLQPPRQTPPLPNPTQPDPLQEDKATLSQLLSSGGSADDRMRLLLLLKLHPQSHIPEVPPLWREEWGWVGWPG